MMMDEWWNIVNLPIESFNANDVPILPLIDKFFRIDDHSSLSLYLFFFKITFSQKRGSVHKYACIMYTQTFSKVSYNTHTYNIVGQKCVLPTYLLPTWWGIWRTNLAKTIFFYFDRRIWRTIIISYIVIILSVKTRMMYWPQQILMKILHQL